MPLLRLLSNLPETTKKGLFLGYHEAFDRPARRRD
jgi:hypothetical protein